MVPCEILSIEISSRDVCLYYCKFINIRGMLIFEDKVNDEIKNSTNICHHHAMFVLTITKDPRGVCRRADALLTLFVLTCAYWCPTHIVLCFRLVFRRLVYPIMPVSHDCPFLIVPSIFSKVYLRIHETTICLQNTNIAIHEFK
jgi:hypothetical protein